MTQPPARRGHSPRPPGAGPCAAHVRRVRPDPPLPSGRAGSGVRWAGSSMHGSATVEVWLTVAGAHGSGGSAPRNVPAVGVLAGPFALGADPAFLRQPRGGRPKRLLRNTSVAEERYVMATLGPARSVVPVGRGSSPAPCSAKAATADVARTRDRPPAAPTSGGDSCPATRCSCCNRDAAIWRSPASRTLCRRRRPEEPATGVGCADRGHSDRPLPSGPANDRARSSRNLKDTTPADAHATLSGVASGTPIPIRPRPVQ